MKNEIKFAHVNMRSLNTGFNEFSLEITTKDYDLVLISETWLNDRDDINFFSIPNYTFINKNRNNGRGGGVGFYIKNNLNYSKFNSSLFSFTANLEQLWIKISFAGKVVGIGVLYRPPHGLVHEFFEEFENVLSNIIPQVDEVICAGDININLLEKNQGYRDFTNITVAYGLTQIVDEPTRISRTGVSLLDVILISDEELLSSTGVYDMHGITDHRLTYADLKFCVDKPCPKYYTYRDFKNFDYNEFLLSLYNVDWDFIYILPDVDSKVQFMSNTLVNLFNLHAPLRTIRITKAKAPWLTYPLRLMIKEREKLHTRFSRTKLPAHWEEYRVMRNFTTSCIRAEKKAYITEIHKSRDSKKLWGTLRTYNISQKNKSYDIPGELKEPNELNNYFLNVNVPDIDISHLKEYYNKNLHQNIAVGTKFKFKTVSNEDIEKIVNSLHSNAIGEDDISLKMLKFCVPYLIPYIRHIVNFAITSYSFPQLWKKAIVRPIAKVKNPLSFGDIRPISVLPLLSKIIEKVMCHQIREYISQKELLPETQSGYRPHHSTTTALLKLTNDVISTCDKSDLTILVMIDFSKAFDTLNHELLCAKLSYYGFDSDSISLIRNYLNGRMQKVCVEGNTSQYQPLRKGIAQGSVLGPLLFILYCADFTKTLSKCQYHSYADDTQIYISTSVNNLGENLNVINNELQQLVALSENHHLLINPNKSRVMIFGPKNVRQEAQRHVLIKVNDVELPVVSSQKNLGLVLDEDLRFKEHVANLIRRAYCSLRCLYANKSILNNTLKIMLCESLVLSIFNYCDVVYSPCLDLLTSNRIQKVQNSCIRFIFNLRKREHVSHRIREIHWLKMKQRVMVHYANLVHSVVTHKTPNYLSDILIQNSVVHDVNTRNKFKYRIPPHKTALFQNSFAYVGVCVYNKIPDEFKKLTESSFKTKIKEFLRENYESI